MSTPLVIIVTLIYAGVAFDQMFMKSNINVAVMFTGYAIANLGILGVVK